MGSFLIFELPIYIKEQLLLAYDGLISSIHFVLGLPGKFIVFVKEALESVYDVIIIAIQSLMHWIYAVYNNCISFVSFLIFELPIYIKEQLLLAYDGLISCIHFVLG